MFSPISKAPFVTKMKENLHLTEVIATAETLYNLDLADKAKVTIWVGADERPIYLSSTVHWSWVKSRNRTMDMLMD